MMNNMLKKLQTLWVEMIKEAERENKMDQNIIVHKDRSAIFQDNFEHLYNKVKRTNMIREVVFLDRHKVTSIIICSVIKTQVMDYQISDDNRVFLGNYHLALSIGLSYLQYEMNQMLRRQGKPLINKISFPDVAYGNSSYKENLISMLYFSDKDGNLNVLNLSHTIFLLEKFNFLKM